MKKFTKHYEYSDSLLDCLRDLRKIADVCAIIGDNTYPQSDLLIDTPNIINSYYSLVHDGDTSCFYLGFNEKECEVGQDLDDVKDRCYRKPLFLIKLTMKCQDITMEVKML